MKQLGVLGSIAYDNIFVADSVPTKGERVFGSQLGRHMGGMGANMAIEAARYSNTVQLFGMVGDDASGREIIAGLRARGVLTDRLSVSATVPTGQSFMFLTGGKSDYFSVVTPDANMRFDPKKIREAVCSIRGGALLLSLEISEEAVAAAIAAAKEANVYLYLCPSPAESCSPDVLKNADALILNQREAELLLDLPGGTPEEIAEGLREMDTPHELILLTLGGNGALLKENKTVYHAPAFDVKVLDTVGAGDALAGAFAAAREAGFSPARALAYSCIAGSLAVSVIGAQSSTHTAEQVERYYREFYEKGRLSYD